MDGPLWLEGIEEGAKEHRVIKFWREPLNKDAFTLL
jgi:hypothetical protein